MGRRGMDTLSDRQREVLDLVCRQGLAQKEVGAALGIAPDTVKCHLTSIYDRLGVRGLGAVCFAYGRECANTCVECGQPDGDHTGDCLAIN